MFHGFKGTVSLDNIYWLEVVTQTQCWIKSKLMLYVPVR